MSNEPTSEGNAGETLKNYPELSRARDFLIGLFKDKSPLRILGYTEKQIDVISRIILATQFPHTPKTNLEEIMCDADLDNLGREDFYEKSELLRRELGAQGVAKSPRQWYEGLLPFLEQHRYFTQAARQLRQERKEQYMREIKELLGA